MKCNKKETTGEEHLERSCRLKMDIIRGLVSGQNRSKDRILCENWFNFLSLSAKHEARARDCVLDQMVRQLQQIGHLSHPFTTPGICGTDLQQLLDEKGRQRLFRLSNQERVASKPSRGKRASPFVWRQKIQHLDTLEEHYRREEQELWHNEVSVRSLPKLYTGIKEVGIQVGLPMPIPRDNRGLLDRAPKKQQPKEQRDREQNRGQDHNLSKVAERRP
ncbi:uncharacterized protein LOC110177171 [Drosophila serrata]|uniref:uncharacterized protein LOC110177171 n=1 Tax=Drosophila serrata TaxID=7274 RepID=UPI000A1D0974|nr:uncharacterized protein LOC110177171 [Drosophila serrata]